MFMTNSSDIGLICDVCGRTVQGITYINGMKFCAKCYQETFGKPEVVVSWAKDNPFEKLSEEVEHWRKLYQERDRQFQSVRQRYHLLNRLQADYNKKDKLHLSEMQCLELTNENETLRKALELACKTYYEDCGEEDCPCGESESFDNSYDGCRYCEAQDGHSEINKNGKCWYNYFIHQAKEMLNEQV